MPKISQTRREQQAARIRTAAERCFARTGFHGTSMDQIIAETGMSSSTVYRYYPDGKQSLIRAVSAARIEPLLAWITGLSKAAHTPSPSEVFADAIRMLWLHGTTQPQDFNEDEAFDISAHLAANAWTELYRDAQIRDMITGNYRNIRTRLTALVRRWQENGTVSSRLPATQTAALIQNTAFGLIVEQVITGHVNIPATARNVETILAPKEISSS